jgi:hypothetical protein
VHLRRLGLRAQSRHDTTRKCRDHRRALLPHLDHVGGPATVGRHATTSGRPDRRPAWQGRRAADGTGLENCLSDRGLSRPGPACTGCKTWKRPGQSRGFSQHAPVMLDAIAGPHSSTCSTCVSHRSQSRPHVGQERTSTAVREHCSATALAPRVASFPGASKRPGSHKVLIEHSNEAEAEAPDHGSVARAEACLDRLRALTHGATFDS